MWHKQDLSQLKQIPVKNNNKALTLDTSGYFLIRLNREEKMIEVGFCTNDHVIRYQFNGFNAMDLCKTIADTIKLEEPAHAMYLGRELQRAEDCLKNNSEYIQD
jgi:thymidylate synthase